jgi:hypothetical protein
MIRLIASDLDGTIIDARNCCDPRIPAEIARLRRQGAKFTVCSGRPLDSVLPLLDGWGLAEHADYVVGSNGGEVLETATGKKESVYALSPELIREIIDLYAPLDLIPTLYDGMTLYVSRITEGTKVIARRIGVNCVVGDIKELTVTPQLKLMFIVEPEKMAEVEKFAAEHPDERFYGFKTAVDLFELSNPMLAKDIGVQIVAAMMRITPAEIMAFGDTTNDLEMLRWVRYGVAMENGTDDAKAAAWKTAPSVEECGFAVFLREHVTDTLEVI